MFSKNLRITKPFQFYKIKKNGKSLFGKDFTVKYCKEDGLTKYTVIVPKTVSSISPKRNKMKRIFRSLLVDLSKSNSRYKEGYLIVVYPKFSSLKRDYSELKLELSDILNQIK